MGTGFHLGTGTMSWPAAERRSDRYGCVMIVEGDVNEGVDGLNGWIVAKVLETRESGHIGDLFRGIFPVAPSKGEEIHLGHGTAFYLREAAGENLCVGVRPPEPRGAVDWMNPEMLYRAHEQTVELWFLPDSEVA
jgi:hypothetical protein